MKSIKVSRRQALKGMAVAGAAAMAYAAGASPTARGSLSGPGVGELQVNPGACYLPYVKQKGLSSDLNFVIVMCDTLRYDHIGFHGNPIVQTPHIDAFAAESVVFDRAYIGGFPTLLNRAELLTGRYTYTYMGWEDLHENELVVADVMNQAGYTTGLVFDTWHLKSHGFTYDRGFDSWRWIRGQEDDRYGTVPISPTLPAAPEKMRYGATAISQYLRNMHHRAAEEDYLCAQTMQSAIDWLRDIHGEDNFFLVIDSFDPHEPWDPPQSYVDLYSAGYVGEEVIYPAYAPSDYLTPEELNHVRALYAAEVTLVDHWLGELFGELDRLGVWQDTVVVLTSDHGILQGEHGVMGKAWNHDGHYECYPLYQELAHVPLMIRVPGVSPRRVLDLAQPADLMPTVLDLAGVDLPQTVHGVSLAPAILGGAASAQDPTREHLVSGRSLTISLSALPRLMATDGEWVLSHGAGHAASALYYLPDDPQQQDNLIGSNCPKALSLHEALVTQLEAVGTAESLLSPWRTVPRC